MGKKLRNFEDGIVHGMVIAAQMVFDQDGDVRAFEILDAAGVEGMQPRQFDELERPVIKAYNADKRRKKALTPKEGFGWTQHSSFT